MKLLRVKTPGQNGREFYINQDAVESFGCDPKSGAVVIFCKGDSEDGYQVAETINEILEQIEP